MNGFDYFAIWKKPEEVFPVTYGDTVSKAGLILIGLTAVLLAVFLYAFFRRFRAGRRGDKEASLVGGAVLTAEYAAEIKADFYSKDAMCTVRVAEEVFG